MLSAIVAIVVIAIDIITKQLVLANLKNADSLEVIDGVLRFSYVENRGAAFGMLQNNRLFFLAASIVIIAAVGFVIVKVRGKNRLLDVVLGLILGGGIGNMIDRISLGYVVDFIDFYAFSFWKWVFNVADSAVVVGCILFAVVIFTDKKLFGEDTKKTGEEKDE